MVKEIRQASAKTKHNIQVGYEVVALSAAVAAAVKVATLPKVQDMAVWQVVAAVVLAGVLAKVFALMAKEV